MAVEKTFGYLAHLVSRILILCGITGITGEPVLSGSPENKKGKDVKKSGSLSTPVKGSDKLQATLRVGNSVESATEACIRLAVSCFRFRDSGGMNRNDNGKIVPTRRNMAGKISDAERSAASAVVTAAFGENPKHSELFASAIKVLVNEATARDRAFRPVILVNKTGEPVGVAFGIPTRIFGLPGTDAERFGNESLSGSFAPYGLSIRSLTDGEMEQIKKDRTKAANDAKQRIKAAALLASTPVSAPSVPISKAANQ